MITALKCAGILFAVWVGLGIGGAFLEWFSDEFATEHPVAARKILGMFAGVLVFVVLGALAFFF